MHEAYILGFENIVFYPNSPSRETVISSLPLLQIKVLLSIASSFFLLQRSLTDVSHTKEHGISSLVTPDVPGSFRA